MKYFILGYLLLMVISFTFNTIRVVRFVMPINKVVKRQRRNTSILLQNSNAIYGD